MTEDWLDEEIRRVRLTAPPRIFSSEKAWGALVPALAARSRARHIRRAAAIAAFGAAAFASGWAVRDTFPGRAPGSAPVGQPFSATLEVQRTGAELIAQLASVRHTLARDGGDATAAIQAQGVAVSILTGAAAELTRMDPANARLAEILRLGVEARRQFDDTKPSDAP